MKIPKHVHMFDTFTGLPKIVTAEERALARDGLLPGSFRCELSSVAARMESLGQYELHPGLSQKPCPYIRSTTLLHPCRRGPLYVHARSLKLADRCLVPDEIIVFDDFENAIFPGVSLAIQHSRSSVQNLTVSSEHAMLRGKESARSAITTDRRLSAARFR